MTKRITRKLVSTLLAALLLLLTLSVGYIGFGGSGLTWTYNDASKTLTISGNGAMNDYEDYSSIPWSAHRHEITRVILEEGITRIGQRAFYEFSALTEIVIPNSVETIGILAFYCCSNLVSVEFGTGLKNIGDSAFYGCDALVSVVIPDSTLVIEPGAFQDCDALQNVHIGDGVQSIGIGAFSNSPVINLYVGKDVVSIGEYAFCNCKLTELTLGESVETIGNYAFAYCQLTKVTLYNKVKVIGDGAFIYQNGREDSIITYGIYHGTEAEFAVISIGQNNKPFTDAAWSFADAHVHSYTGVVTKAATCTEAGVKTFTCTCCDSYTEPVAALGHIDANDDGVCDRCRTQMRANEPDKQKEEQSFFEKLLEMIREFFYKLFHLFG